MSFGEKVRIIPAVKSQKNAPAHRAILFRAKILLY